MNANRRELRTQKFLIWGVDPQGQTIEALSAKKEDIYEVTASFETEGNGALPFY
jgi:hypothetical protein